MAQVIQQVNINKILNSDGPIVNAVLLSASEGTKDVQVDTTPKKQMVQKILGGSFTFLGQYEDEGIVLMVRRDQDEVQLPTNNHKLQPPFHETTVKGDILALKVAPEGEEGDENINMNKANDEFFLNYTKDEYVKFEARTDIKTVTPTKTAATAEEEDVEFSEGEDDEDDEEEMEGEDDSEDEEDGEGGFLELLMGQVLQRFQQDNGRMPDEQELAALQSAISQKLAGVSA